MRKKSFRLSRLEKTLLFFLGAIFLWATGGLLYIFYQEHTIETPSSGGVYREGFVGDISLLNLNPVFVFGKRDRGIDADISSLIFSGLMKFDSLEGKMKDHLADHTLSSDKKTYTFRLKEGLKWHDGASLTSDDIMFTFQSVIQHKDFSNESLKQAFKEVKIEQINEREVTFTIPYPYKFFLTNFTVGILPKHILKDIPVSEMEYHSFSQNPIGNGPFSYGGIEEVKRNIFQIRLDSFNKSLYSPFLDAVEFRIYPSKNALSLDSKHLTAVRPFFSVYQDDFSLNSSLLPQNFSLPQYSALFFNLKNNIFNGESGRKLRLGMQLATNKNDLLKITKGNRIDTPLLETNRSEWLYEFDLKKANGALKDAGFYLPHKKPKTFVLPGSESKWITNPTTENTWVGTKASFSRNEEDEESSLFTFSGDYPLKIGSVKVWLNGEEKISQEKPELARKWSFSIPFDTNITEGTHEIRIEFYDFDDIKKDEDALSIYIEPEAQEEVITDAFEIREDQDGEKLSLTLLTSTKPYFYQEVAEFLKEDYGKIGIDLQIKVLPMASFLDSVRHREYDIVLYGQNLGYNLDIYEFFHESQVGEENLSDYQNPQASVLIEEIRSSHVQAVRDKKLQELREILKQDIPAIFLFSPQYSYFIDSNVSNINVEYVGLLKDRVSGIDSAYITRKKSFQDGYSWIDFPGWFFKSFVSFITFSL